LPSLIDFAPSADDLLKIEPEDLGLILMRLIHAGLPAQTIFTMSRFETPLWRENRPGYPQHRRKQVARAIAEAWQWLMTEGLIMPAPDQSADWFCLTRRGERLKTSADTEAYRKGDLLPASTLHPVLLEKVRPMFLRGDYDIAIFTAFRQVEIDVRAAGGFSADVVGVDLMRTAFNSSTGLLTDLEAVPAEREALSHLFAGAIGHAKNPGSHRSVIVNATEAAQLIGFASYLLDVVEARAQKKSSKS
jgi:uncharacterized protein (TIGR02391 family)